LHNYETQATINIRLTDFEHNILYQSSDEEMVKRANAIDIVFSYDGKPIELMGDVLIDVFKKGQVKTVELFHFWINTRFVHNGKVSLVKTDIDGIHRDTKKYSADFSVECEFDIISTEEHDPIQEQQEEFLRRARASNVKIVPVKVIEEDQVPMEIAVQVSLGGHTENFLLEVDNNSFKEHQLDGDGTTDVESPVA